MVWVGRGLGLELALAGLVLELGRDPVDHLQRGGGKVEQARREVRVGRRGGGVRPPPGRHHEGPVLARVTAQELGDLVRVKVRVRVRAGLGLGLELGIGLAPQP